MDNVTIPENDFGKIKKVTRVGLGGEGVLRTHGMAAEAKKVISEAAEQKITYFDCARVYADSERYYGAVWGARPDARSRVFQASKSAGRTAPSWVAYSVRPRSSSATRTKGGRACSASPSAGPL